MVEYEIVDSKKSKIVRVELCKFSDRVSNTEPDLRINGIRVACLSDDGKLIRYALTQQEVDILRHLGISIPSGTNKIEII